MMVYTCPSSFYLNLVLYNKPLLRFNIFFAWISGSDLTDSQKVLSWLTSEDVFSAGDEIEDVNRHMLDKLLNEDDFVAVYFCKFFVLSNELMLISSNINLWFHINLDSNVCPSCKKVLEGLESIDDETDALDITFVKINDPRYAKKYGVNKIPALVYFRKKFPSIYRGEKIDILNISCNMHY